MNMSRPNLVSLVLLVVSAAVATTAAAIVPADAATSGVPGAYVATTPTRVLDTRTGAYGNRKGAVGADRATAVKVTGTSGVPASAAAVAVTISVVSATRNGSITASTYGVTPRPNVTHLQFVAGRAATGAAVVELTSERIELWNVSDGPVQLVMDVTGYYIGGTPTADGALRLLSPKRVVDTRTGVNGCHKGSLGAGRTLSPDLSTLAGLPSNAGAVAATVSVFGAARSGSLIAYASRTTRPSAPLLDFTAHRAVSQYAVLPISDIQGLSLYNASSGSVQIVVDVFGYLTSGAAALAHGQQVVAANRIYRDGTLPGGGSDTVPVLGRGGVPKTNIAVVVVTVRVSAPARAGTLVGSLRPAPRVVSFSRGQRVSNHVMLHVLNGRVTLRNTSSGALTLEVEIVGYVPSTSLTFPTSASVARYPNDLTTDPGYDGGLMYDHGTADAASGATFVLLDLGAQTVHDPLSVNDPGIALALTSPTVRLSYDDLVTIISRYIDGLQTGSHYVTLAVGTNNDGDWSTYDARTRGRHFANRLIDRLAAYGVSRNVTVIGANDIESIFGSRTAEDAIAWESAYFANTTADLVFNGALVGCPTVFGSTADCDLGWTQQDYVTLTRHVENAVNRVQVLPQTYFPVQAVQWANIFARSGSALRFVGSLTQYGADPSTYLPNQGWAALVRALQWRVGSPRVPRMVDIAPAA